LPFEYGTSSRVEAMAAAALQLGKQNVGSTALNR
jgi:hypothetical protein